jgi:uncharacterized protein (TIGR03083 family)
MPQWTDAGPWDDVLAATIAATNAALAPLTGADWSRPAGDVEWTCRATAAHLADDYFAYASQLIAQPESAYLPVEAVIEADADPELVLRAIDMCGQLLRLAVRAAHPSARGWHPMGSGDASGFAAMGTTEALVHTADIARGLGHEWRPPAALCEPVLARIFPDAPAGDPTDVLLWCTGRAPLGDRERLTRWRWYGAPPE